MKGNCDKGTLIMRQKGRILSPGRFEAMSFICYRSAEYIYFLLLVLKVIVTIKYFKYTKKL